ncbi:beta-lactamase family protein [Acetobacter sp. AN02]|uniref:serine hydrolase domain-containing protein n=1 Tax=Acetobacter sp. AN02 TaxID=2894186 RepID=UPI002434229F|nr:serine hydrolase [Acetobacter sp. AN02]MDG6094755.1 beta-lactamase family protein [Acetobacter sp. AN02]
MADDRIRAGRREVLLGTLAAGAGLMTGAAGADAPWKADELISAAVVRGDLPGAVLAVGHGGRVVHRGVFGYRALEPVREVMSPDTRFDMASLTKVIVTAPSVMQLWERDLFRLDDPVSLYLPDFGVNGKRGLTIRQLLTHYSGLPPDVDLSDPWTGRDEGIRRAFASVPLCLPDTKFIYSDINFIVLGLLVEKLSGQRLDAYAQQHTLTPLGMSGSEFLPLQRQVSPEIIAPTQRDETGRFLRGVVHDPTSRRMGGVAGHAGLFSDAADMSLFAQSFMDRRAGRKSSFPLAQKTVLLMTTPQSPAGLAEQRGLGWDISSHYATPRGDVFPVGSFGHTGFTGTSLWMDPASDTWVLLLTNRVHPSGGGGEAIVHLRHEVATAVARELAL